eukprot:GCRY01002277.1.p1 GENE.GCRY01002277.1~~GCRY01002277.1.p1  ORF type:complete len:466 (+),score=123.50 GCRY01002277.1:132-1400(+)
MTNQSEPTEYSNLIKNEASIQADKAEPLKTGNASMNSATFNLANTVIGAGVLGLPYALAQTGTISGALMLLCAAVASGYSLVLLVKASEITGEYEYKAVAKRVWGEKIGNLVQCLILFYTTGTCIAYPVLLGDFVPSIFKDLAPSFILVHRTWALLLLAVFIIMPLCLIKDVNRLRITSFLALVFVLWAVAIVVLRFGQNGIAKDVTETIILKPTFFMAMPMMAVAFTAHYNLLPIYQGLKDATPRKMITVVQRSQAWCFTMYLLIACAGYVQFGSDVKGDILATFSDHDNLVLSCRIGLAIVLLFSYPLVFFATRRSINFVFFKGTESTELRHYAVTLTLISFCVFIAWLVPDISIVFSYNGSLFGCAIVYTVPALMYRSLAKPLGKSVFLPTLVVIMGIGFGVMGFLSTTLHLAKVNGFK